MSGPGSVPATEHFASALDLVRRAPVEREQGITLTPPPPAPLVAAGVGEVVGAPDDLWATAEGLATGRLSPHEVIGRVQDRIARLDHSLGAFVTVDHDALDAARLRPERGDRDAEPGPLWCVPLTVKDIVDVAGLPTTGSTQGLAPRRPARDSTAVARLRAAGAVVAGKVQTHELALGVTTPQSANPWSPERIPGGSSGGSAISVMTGMAYGSVGTDTRASIRVPPALCGGVGMRPTQGLVPVDGWTTLSWSMDVIAPIARTVRDLALMLDVMSDSGDRFRSVLPGRLEGLSLGVVAASLAGCHSGVATRFAQVLDLAGAAGAKIVDLTIDNSELEVANAAGMVVSRAEAAEYHRDMGTDVNRCSSEVAEQLRAGRELTAGDYLRALRVRAGLSRRMSQALSGIDLMIMPTTKSLAPLRSEAELHLLSLSENCVPWSLLDFPAMSIFAGMVEGLPSGVQLVGQTGADELVLSAAHALERLIGPAPLALQPG